MQPSLTSRTVRLAFSAAELLATVALVPPFVLGFLVLSFTEPLWNPRVRVR